MKDLTKQEVQFIKDLLRRDRRDVQRDLRTKTFQNMVVVEKEMDVEFITEIISKLDK